MARPKKIESAKVTWLGEDDLHEEGNGPKSNAWNGIVFPKGEPVEVDQPAMIAKAKVNKFYAVEGFKVQKNEPEPE